MDYSPQLPARDCLRLADSAAVRRRTIPALVGLPLDLAVAAAELLQAAHCCCRVARLHPAGLWPRPQPAGSCLDLCRRRLGPRDRRAGARLAVERSHQKGPPAHRRLAGEIEGQSSAKNRQTLHDS
jgi:hypothetical protein